jgi:flavin reductase (DIM6/NTAB) family NADH-FMN oxidoreductase RutF
MAFDPMEQRRIMGHFATGVTVVTSRLDEALHGMTANAVSYLSLDPPLVLVAVDLKAGMHTVLKSSDCFAMNILTVEQEALSTRFATRGPKDFSDIDTKTLETGAPVFTEALAYLDCRIVNVLSGGDHDIFIGEVVAGDVRDGRPLMFYQGKYGVLKERKG